MSVSLSFLYISAIFHRNGLKFCMDDSLDGTFYSKKQLHKSCWKCNFEDFLFYDFFSWNTSFSHKWHFFRIVLQKLAIFGKRGHFRAKSHFIRVVENAILNIFYFIIFFLDAFCRHKWHLKMTSLGHFPEWSFKNWPFLAKGGISEQKVTS